MIDVKSLTIDQLEAVVNWQRFTDECANELRRRRYESDPNVISHETTAPRAMEGGIACPWCGRQNPSNRTRFDDDGNAIGSIIWCGTCRTWYDERGRGVLPQNM